MVRGIAALATGQALGQVLYFAFIPFLTRVYAPEAHGVLGLFQAFTGVAYALVSLRYDVAIASVSDRAEAARLFAGAVMLSVPGTLLALVAWAALVQGEVLGYAEARLADAPLAALAAAATSLYFTARFWLIREREYATAAKVQVVQSAVRGVAQSGLAWWPGGTAGLVFGEVVARLAGLGRMMRRSVAGLREGFGQGGAAIRSTLYEHRTFAIWGLPSTLVNAATAWLPVPLVVASFGVGTGGLLALSTKVLTAPMLLLGASTADAFQSEFSRVWGDDQAAARRLFRRTTGGLLLIALVMTAAVMLLAPRLFATLFGPEWAQAGRIAAVQAPWVFASLAVSPVSRLIFVLRGQRFKFLYDACGLAGMFAVWGWGQREGWSVEQLIGAWTVLQVCLYALYYGIMEALVAWRMRG